MEYNLEELRSRLEQGYYYVTKGKNVGGISAITNRYVENDDSLLIFKNSDNGIFYMKYEEDDIKNIVELLKEFNQEFPV